MKTVKVDHELDKLFNITPGQTEAFVPGSDQLGELVPIEGTLDGDVGAAEQYDAKDEQIEGELAEIQKCAVEAYETMILAAQTVTDKKYAAENAEVAASFLNIALNAVKEKNSTKDRKDKIAARKQAASSRGSGQVQHITNNIVTDRETALRLARERRNNGTQE